MKNRLLAGTLVVAAFGIGAAPAAAQVISIGLQEAGVNGGAITTVASGALAVSAPASVPPPGKYGSFNYIVNATDFTGADLTSTSTAFLVSGSGTLNVFVTETGLTVAVPDGGTFDSGLTQDELTSGDTAVLSTWLNPSNLPYGGANGPSTGNGDIQLATYTFTAIGSQFFPGVTASPSGVYALTEEYSITSGAGHLTSTSTIDLTTTPGGGGFPPPPIPETPTWTMMGIGFAVLALAGVTKRRRKGPRFAA